MVGDTPSIIVSHSSLMPRLARGPPKREVMAAFQPRGGPCQRKTGRVFSGEKTWELLDYDRELGAKCAEKLAKWQANRRGVGLFDAILFLYILY